MKYDLGYGKLGNGVTVWNRAEEEHGDYKTVAHIASDGKITWRDKKMPASVKAKIKKAAKEIDLKTQRGSSQMESNITEMTAPKQQTPEQIKAIVDKLKPKQKIQLWYDSSIKKGENWVTVVVGRKSFSKKYNVGKVTLTYADAPRASKLFFYDRDGKISLALGDMAARLVAINTSVKEGQMEAKLTERAEKMLSDREQEIVRKALEKATGVDVESEVGDVRYHAGNSDFAFEGGVDLMLYVGYYEGDPKPYTVSIENMSGQQIAMQDAKDFKSIVKLATNMAKKYKKRLTTESKLTERAEKMLSDREQEIVRKSLEKATGVDVESEVGDVRYHAGNSDFAFDGGGDTMLYVGYYEDEPKPYTVSIENMSGQQITMEDAKDFKSVVKLAMKMAKKYKKRLTTESKLNERTQRIQKGDTIHFNKVNKTGYVVKVSGDSVTIKTLKGNYTGKVKDAQQVRGEGYFADRVAGVAKTRAKNAKDRDVKVKVKSKVWFKDGKATVGGVVYGIDGDTLTIKTKRGVVKKKKSEVAVIRESYKVAGKRVTLVKGKKSDGTDWKVKFQNGKEVSLSDVLSLIKPFPKGIKEIKFSKAQLNRLGTEYEKIKGDKLPLGASKKLKAFLSMLDKEALEQMRDAKIKFISDEAGKILKKATNESSLNEADYKVYHKSFTGSADEARKFAEKRGFEIDEDDWQSQIGLGGRNIKSRPSVGKTHNFTVGLLKDGKPQRKALQISVYGMKNGYELNAYIN